MQLPVENYGEDRFSKIQVGSVRAVFCLSVIYERSLEPLLILHSSLFLPSFNSNAILSAYADDVIVFF